MKHLKKIIFTVVLAAALSTSAFAESGFEFILNVPVGMGINLFPTFDFVATTPKVNGGGKEYLRSTFNSDNRLGFDVGVSAQVGYMWQVVNNFGISLLGEIGYSFDSLYGTYKLDKAEAGSPIAGTGYDEAKISTYTHNLKIGILPKFNINAFSIGIGGGIIVPMAVSQSVIIYGKDVYKDSGKTPEMVNVIGGYAKLTFDYSIFFTDKIAMNIGLYTGVDFVGGVQTYLAGTKTTDEAVYTESLFVTYDIGLQLGFRFGPKAFN